MGDFERSRITAATDRIYLGMRHRDAWSSAASEPLPGAQGFESLRGHKYCLLTTFRKDGGEPVPTPVWFGLEDGKLYLHTEARVGKVKRIRGNPRVRVAPCTMRGKPLGPPAEGTAHLLAPEDSERGERAIAANYRGLIRRLYALIYRRLAIDGRYIEVVPSPGRADAAVPAEAPASAPA